MLIDGIERMNVMDPNNASLPTGREDPKTIRMERDFSRLLKLMGLRLIADRTRFVDPHYQGGYQIVSSDRILAGRDYDLSIMDVSEWLRKETRKEGKKRA